MKRVLFAATIALAVASTTFTAAIAAGGTSTLSANTSVISNCTQMPTQLSVSFNYDVFLSGPWQGPGEVGNATINCTKGSFPRFSYSGGNGTNDCNGLFSAYGKICRAMTNGAATLVYFPVVCYEPTSVNSAPPVNFTYCDSMTSPGFQDGAQPGAAGNASTEQTHLYWFVSAPGGQDVPVGSYSDSFTMTLNY